MREKLLIFVNLTPSKVADKELEIFINQFRSNYKHLRLVSEVDSIDYSIQSVKVICIVCSQRYVQNKYPLDDGTETYYNVNFTNTSGRIYKTYNLMKFTPH